MRFRKNAGLDTSQIEDRRGSGSSMGMPGGPIAVGGGGVGLLVVVAFILIQALSGGGAAGSTQTPSDLAQSCRTGADANAREDCRIVGVVNSVQQYWSKALPQYDDREDGLLLRRDEHRLRPGEHRRRAVLLPRRQARVHRPRLLRRASLPVRRARRAVRRGIRARARVRSSCAGSRGNARRARSDRQGPQSGSVRTELQADCLAGVWANHAQQTGFITGVTQADIADALDAAAAVGDDRIQSETQGQVNPETWTHGSSKQREHWFTTGFKAGKLGACDTFKGSI